MNDEKKPGIWSEIRNNFIDGDTGDRFIDAWESEDDISPGKVIAVVHKDGSVEYKDIRAMRDKYAQEMIQEAIEDAKIENVSKIPVEILDEMIRYLEDEFNNLVSEGVGDPEGMFLKIAKYLEFLESLRELYWECPSCGRTIAPDEEYVVKDETKYCKLCSEQGVI